MISLDAFDTRTRANKGVEIELRHVATGKGAGAFVTVHGKDSDVFRRAKGDREREARELLTRPGKDELTLDEQEELQLRFLAACVAGWRELESGGKPLEYSDAAAFVLLRDFPAIREQVDRAIANRENFLLA